MSTVPSRLLVLYLLKINNKSSNMNSFLAGHNSGIESSSGLMFNGFSLRVSLMLVFRNWCYPPTE